MFYAQILVNGVLLGGLYGLMALGMALVWGVLNIVNLAHGSFIMLGGYAVYYLFTLAGIDPFLALPLGMLIMFCVRLSGAALSSSILLLVPRYSTPCSSPSALMSSLPISLNWFSAPIFAPSTLSMPART